jgi:biopolymer transport protein ExbB/TolQ
MLQFIAESGPFMILMLIVLIGLIILMVKKTIDIFISKKEVSSKDESSINAILFWGCISALIGVLGQLSGLYLTINAIAMAKDISPQVILIGLKISFNTTIFGLWVLLVSSIVWFFLKARFKQLVANS